MLTNPYLKVNTKQLPGTFRRFDRPLEGQRQWPVNSSQVLHLHICKPKGTP
jgi:hypothetical protein